METVTSADGTIIAYDRTGDGPVLIVSVGAFCTRHTFVPPAELTRRFTVVTYDRRGRGDSSDTVPFAPEREYEDLAAVTAERAETGCSSLRMLSRLRGRGGARCRRHGAQRTRGSFPGGTAGVN